MTLLRMALILCILAGGIAVILNVSPARSRLVVMSGKRQFPLVSGFNLNRQEIEFPSDFEGKINLVILPFRKSHQRVVNTWIPIAQEIERTYPGFVYYELPTIYNMGMVSRTFINEGMRAGIPDQTSRERTITLYLDKERFKSALDIPSEENISIFLVTEKSEILWRTTGEYTPDKAEELIRVIQKNP